MDRSKEITHKIMSSIKSKNTLPEIILGKELWKQGLRYRKHYKIFGKPDFAFVKKKIAIFCDGDFWHGNNWRVRGLNNLEVELSRYSSYWSNKIRSNIERDKTVNAYLTNQGWVVIRIFESEIRSNIEDVCLRIMYLCKKL